MNASQLTKYIQDVYGAEPEHLWEKYPDTFIIRHQNNRKWFAVVMAVQRNRLGLDGEGCVELADLKCGPLLGGSYIGKPGVVPAWHMNKTHWLGVLLDGSAEDALVRELVELSYELTKGKI